jgi:DegV family protein with EDD domain
MAPVTIVSDSTQYLPREVAERHGIQIVSLWVNWNGRTDRESDFADFDAFYAFLRSGGELPTTSQPSVGDFLAVYEPLVERGDDILSIHISGGISGTVGAAEQAREALIEKGMAPERMVVYDSRTGASGHGFVTLAATNAVAAGGGLAEALAAAQAMREDTYILMAVDTLEFLRRGGRIGSAQAWIGTTLKVKPILQIDGEMKPVERVRTAGRAFERLVAHLAQRKESGCDAFAVAHTNAFDAAERLAERGREIYGRDPLLFSEIGPVIGTHTGPGLLGVAGVRTDLLGTV